MKWNIHLKENVLLEIFGPEIVEVGHLPSSAGTFSLRQARYFIEIGKQLLKTEQVCALINLIPESDPATEEQILIQNLRRVVNIAKRYTNRDPGLLIWSVKAPRDSLKRWKNSNWRMNPVSRPTPPSAYAETSSAQS